MKYSVVIVFIDFGSFQNLLTDLFQQHPILSSNLISLGFYSLPKNHFLTSLIQNIIYLKSQ